VEDLLGEVLGDRVVVAGEALQRRVAILDPSQPHGREVHRGRPARRARVQEIGLFGGQRDAVELAQQRAGLDRGEGERRRADLRERALAAHPRERERRLRARGEHERDVGREGARGVVQRADAGVVVDLMDVVEDDRDAPAVRLEVGRQAVDRGLDGRRCGVEPLERGRGQVVAQPRGPRRDVGPQPRRVVVAAVERDPRRRDLAVGEPRADGNGLAVAGRRADQRERSVEGAIEQQIEPTSGENGQQWTRLSELALDQPRGPGRRESVLSRH
jgi:hypothetical protein